MLEDICPRQSSRLHWYAFLSPPAQNVAFQLKKPFPDIIIWYRQHLDFELRFVCSNYETVLSFKV